MDGIIRHALVAPEEPLVCLRVIVVLRREHLGADLYGIAVGQGIACLRRDGKVAHTAVVEQGLAERDAAACRTGFVQPDVLAVFAGGDRLGGCGCGGCGLRGSSSCDGCCGFNEFRKVSRNAILSIQRTGYLS